MKHTFFGIIAISILTVSCNKDEKPTYLKEEAGVQTNVAMNSSQKASILDQAGIQNTAQNIAPSLAGTVAPGINPPHGEPGHRCDIPVGQPLNSAPASTNSSQNVNVTGNQTIQIDPNSLSPGKFTADAKTGKTVKTAPGMNPPHGEPGHRCDIPVGQPLNSKPAPQTNVAQNVPTPAPAPQQAKPTGEKPKTNPPHGEPWHDCAVKVGEPLP